MILIDTHIWIWWVSEDKRFTEPLQDAIRASVNDGIGLSVMSCWEVAKLVEKGRLELEQPVDNWISRALSYPGIVLLGLTPEIAIASTQLPGNFHKDPADQLIVATARIQNLPLLTVDEEILNYPHVSNVEI